MSKGHKRQTTPLELLRFFALFLGLSGALGIVLAGLMLPATVAGGLVAKTGTESFNNLPDEFQILPPSEQSVILASDGSQIAHFFAEDRIIVPGDQISKNMKQAIVAVEDRRFYQHHGVDGQGLLRALFSNLSGGPTQGASTLTQQLVKNTLIENGIQNDDPAAIIAAKEPTLGRKIREMNYALSLEKRWSKDQILNRYLNIAPFGSNVYGVEAASLQYFSIHAKDLSKSQATLLAGITQSPVAFDPLRHPERAQQRRDQVAGRMLAEKYLTQKEYDEIIKTPVKSMLKPSERATGCAAAGNAAYFCELAIARLLDSDILGKTKAERQRALMRGGIAIKTTLDPKMQKQAMDAITAQIPIGDPSKFKIALSAIQPGTGNILALAQNTTYGRATKEKPGADFVSYNAPKEGGGGIGRPAGSSYKTMTLGAWFEDEHSAYERVGGKSVFPGSDFTSTCPEISRHMETWKPANVGGISSAATDVIRATNYSINTSYAGMAKKLYDLCKIRSFAERTGAVDGNGEIKNFTPSSIIGTLPVPPLNMANAYATIAANGKRCKPRAILSISDRAGKIIAQTTPECKQTIDPKITKQVSRVLNINNNFYRSQGYANAGRPAASKTGTTNGATNAWLVGYTPQLSAAVWVGNPAGEVPMHNVRINGRFYNWVYGSSIPGPAWGQFMRNALQGQPVMNFEAVSISGKYKPPAPAPRKATETATNDANNKPAKESKPQGNKQPASKKQPAKKN
ncbi:penicillin-binding protein [Actinomycetaceae bacterium TAE3-ERU4]|nr:penicillin-binding protein [Actinomycetaceae bacterium TAE3-ERU4]